jgi:hypothetical protein
LHDIFQGALRAVRSADMAAGARTTASQVPPFVLTAGQNGRLTLVIAAVAAAGDDLSRPYGGNRTIPDG